MVVADLDGQQLVNTAVKGSEPLPRRSPAGIAAQQHALERRALTVSETVWLGPVARTFIATIEVPLFKDGQPYRALAVVMNMGGFQRLLIGQQTPKGWLTGIIDREGRFLARVPDHDRQVGQLASKGWREIMGQEGIFEFKSLEGREIVHGNTHPSIAPWSVGIAAERSTLQSATWQAIRWTTIPGVVLSALSLLFAFVVARHITGPIGELHHNVPALMQGTAVKMDGASPEIQELAAALHRAGLERKLAEDASQRLAAIVRSSFDAIISKTLSGVITSWNASAEQMFGYTAEEAVGRNIRMLIPADRQHEEDTILRRISENLRVEPFETVRLRRDGRTFPVSITISPMTDASGKVIGASKIARDISESKARDEQVHSLLRELSHRSKNLLAVVQAIANRTAAGSSPEFIARFSERLRALAVNQDLLTRNEWHGVDVQALVDAQLEPFTDGIATRIRTSGSPAVLSATAAQSIGMALHELATNASKYGALSTAHGLIDIDWRIADGRFELGWVERDGPQVKEPSRQGFGSLVISTMVEQSLDGHVEFEYAPAGFQWRLSCPVDRALEKAHALS